MYIMANINGYETPIEMGDHFFQPFVEQKENQTIIDHGSYLEICGRVSVEATTVTNGVIEGVVSVELPQGTIFGEQATAHNITDAPDNVTGEAAFVAVNGNTLKVYLTAKSNTAKTMTGSYTVKVVR